MTARYVVEVLPTAVSDIIALFDYIASENGTGIAQGYIDRLRVFLQSLDTFPKRGQSREDIASGLRIISFEGRIAIAVRVRQRRVTVHRIFYGGRDYARALRGIWTV